VAFTPPKTWSFGEILTSTDMNTYVRDNTDDLDTRVSALLAGGIGSNVVQTVKTDTFSTTSTSFTAVTGLSVTITPTSNTSKVLLVAAFVMGGSINTIGTFARITGGNLAFIGDAASNRTRATTGSNLGNDTNFAVSAATNARSFAVVDAPATATATTYSIQVLTTGGTLFIGRNGNNDGDTTTVGRYPASLIAIEVKA